MNEKPSVGRIVHYQSYGTPGGEFRPECRAAIVAAVHDHDECDLVVLNPTGLFFNRCQRSVAAEGSHAGGTWHWPEMV